VVPVTTAYLDQPRWRGTDHLAVAIFVASGAAGLIYQIVWSRQLVLVFGNTTQAVGTIVSAFMAGLGAGGLAGGLLSSRIRRPLLFYGLVELGTGVAALAVPLGFHGIANVYASAYDGATPLQLTLVRLVLTMAVVTPVTFLMGLTLPLLTHHLVDTMRTAGRRMGMLYGANTVGGMAGVLVSGLVLVELVGLSATAAVGVALNLVCGTFAVILGLGRPIHTHGAGAGQPQHEWDRAARRPGLHALLYSTTFVSGFVALALEVLWVRMLAEGTGGLIYNFVVILALYLLGVALGGAAYRACSGARRDTPLALAIALLGVGASAVLTVPLGTLWLGPSHLERTVVMLPATVCMGYAFPLTARLLTLHPGRGGRSIGTLYAWNTVGSILGSLGATFVLVSTLGTNASILAMAAADAAAGLALIATAGRRVRLPRAPAAAVAAGQIGLLTACAVLIGGGSPLLKTATEHWLDKHHHPYNHVEDDLSTADAVGGAPADRRLYVSGTTMTAISIDTKLMAYIPKVIRPNADSFLDICFGMGTTYRSAISLDMHTTAVDLSPSVPDQMPIFYPDAKRYLHSTLGRIITADGHNYVALTSHRYDIISVDPPPPIEAAGAVVLYTHEFYADARRALRPGGLMLEWLYFGVTLTELREHVRTFASVFPHVTLMISPMHGGVYLLGSDRPISWDSATVSQVLGSRQATRDLSSAPDYRGVAGRSWTQLFEQMRWLQDAEVDRFAGTAPLITDDRPRTEYYLLRTLGSEDQRRVTAGMLRRLHP
jgi:spermidine synthase